MEGTAVEAQVQAEEPQTETPSVQDTTDGTAVETQTEVTTQTQEEQPNYLDTYKDKGWVEKIKDEEGNLSEEKMLKQIDNLTSLMGKKDQLPDFENGSEEEIEKFLAKTRPESKDVYEFSEQTAPQVKEAMSDVLHKFGVTSYQANGIVKAYNELEAKIYSEATSMEGYQSSMKEAFGEEWKGKAENIQYQVSQTAGDEVTSALEKVPNQHLGAMYKAIDAILKAHGVEETGAQGNAKPNGNINVDKTADRTKIRSEITELKKKPHTQEQLQSLINRLQATY